MLVRWLAQLKGFVLMFGDSKATVSCMGAVTIVYRTYL